ncbi:MAG TPA: 50S ribosomal protein L29 [Candidatus Paceibacterota bacterium]|jgi:ribosomal protein L29|nr:50S ribosomal protein L29 [Candidatus Paceibacterota bacterium]HRV32009.1 50S ribosomal protein L29 [Candidatus Paceibacterota bacterium]
MKIKDLEKKDLNELQKLLTEKQKQAIQAKFDLKMGKVKNVKILFNLKKDIAQISTIINQLLSQKHA